VTWKIAAGTSTTPGFFAKIPFPNYLVMLSLSKHESHLNQQSAFLQVKKKGLTGGFTLKKNRFIRKTL